MRKIADQMEKSFKMKKCGFFINENKISAGRLWTPKGVIGLIGRLISVEILSFLIFQQKGFPAVG